MICREGSGFWAGCHDVIISHFETCINLIAAGGLRKDSMHYQKALTLLTFRKPREFCLGYTELGTDGPGGGKGYAKLIASSWYRL